MTIQALALFLVSWIQPTNASSEEGSAAVPRWERHPAEQRLLKEQERQAVSLLSRIHRSL